MHMYTQALAARTDRDLVSITFPDDGTLVSKLVTSWVSKLVSWYTPDDGAASNYL